MSEMFKPTKKVAEAAPAAAPAFAPDGERLPNGSVRYKVLCDGGIKASGVFFEKTVAAGAPQAAYEAAQAERDAAVARLTKLTRK